MPIETLGNIEICFEGHLAGEPLLFISGTGADLRNHPGVFDGIARSRAQENMAARVDGATLRFFEGGHLFMPQDRAAFPAMIDFLKGPGH